jgi:hypothetical protein
MHIAAPDRPESRVLILRGPRQFKRFPKWSSADKPEKCTLGTARLILRLPRPEIEECKRAVLQRNYVHSVITESVLRKATRFDSCQGRWYT